MSDVYPIPGRPFVHAYPITHRTITTGLWYMNSFDRGTGAPPPLPVWPPENQPGWSWLGDGSDLPAKQMFMWYADEIPGLVVGNAGPEGPGNPFAYYDHRWFGIQMFCEYEEFYGATFDVYTRSYLYSVGWLHYVIPRDVAQSIERAELVINLDTFGTGSEQNVDDLPFIVQVRSDPPTDYFGYTPSWADFRTITGPSICPTLTALEAEANSRSSEPHTYSDPYPPEELSGWSYGPRHVLPINAAGLAAIQRGGRVGIYCGLAGDTAPTGYNYIFAECDYSWWDTALSTSGPDNAGAYLPHLRLWIGGEVLVSGRAEITLSSRGRIAVPPDPIIAHRARQRRDRS